MEGTASTVRAFLLIQQPGPWGEDALADCRLPDALTGELTGRCAAAGVRPLLIRRHGREQPAGVRVFAAYADPHEPWLETAVLDDVSALLDLDLAALGRGRSVGLPRSQDPIFCVCTHGRHDICCAELGRPLARALAQSHPQHTWECSHIGGDRFAGNLLQLPDGLYYGRADAASGPRIASARLAGHLDLENLRGRAGYGFAIQAAEAHLRRHLDLTELGALRLHEHSVDGELTTAGFAVGEQRWLVTVRCTRAEPTRLTCRSATLRKPLRSEVVSIEQLDTPDR
ncbi:MAG TPA: sucrase ferredoxin [Nocardioidaceae bacterium]|nr:sucrase ferredoxin [Nocardioidaceae bacterium]